MKTNIDYMQDTAKTLPTIVIKKTKNLSLASQNIQKLILKSPRFVPFVSNLTHFGAKSDII